jgi:hypothetical protein
MKDLQRKWLILLVNRYKLSNIERNYKINEDSSETSKINKTALN